MHLVRSSYVQSMFLKVYTQYVNHFNKAITIVARLKRTSEDFRAFLMVPYTLIAFF